MRTGEIEKFLKETPIGKEVTIHSIIKEYDESHDPGEPIPEVKPAPLDSFEPSITPFENKREDLQEPSSSFPLRGRSRTLYQPSADSKTDPRSDAPSRKKLRITIPDEDKQTRIEVDSSPLPSQDLDLLEVWLSRKQVSANHLRVLVRSFLKQHTVRKNDQQFDATSYAYRRIKAERFNFSVAFNALRREFKSLSMDTSLIERTHLLVLQAQTAILSPEKEEKSSHDAWKDSWEALITDMERFCDLQEEQYLLVLKPSHSQSPSEVFTELDSQVYGTHLVFCKQALMHIICNDLESLGSTTLEYTDRISQITPSQQSLQLKKSRVGCDLQQQMGITLEPHQTTYCIDFFFQTLAFVQNKNLDGLMNHVLDLTVRINTHNEKKDTPGEKHEISKEKIQKPASGLQQHHLHSDSTRAQDGQQKTRAAHTLSSSSFTISTSTLEQTSPHPSFSR